MITTTSTSTGDLDESMGGSASPTTSSSGSSGAGDGGGTTTGATGFDTSAACPQIYEPVCGKDGETYDNACVAAGAGVEIRREGPCLGDCEGSCGVTARAPSLLGALLLLALVKPRRRRRRTPPEGHPR